MRQDGGAGDTPVTHVMHGTFVSVVMQHKLDTNSTSRVFWDKFYVLLPSTPAAALGLNKAFLQCMRGAYRKNGGRLLR